MHRELVVSVGDPQGIGPEIAVSAARRWNEERPEARVILCGDRRVLDELEGAALPSCEESGAGVFVLDVPWGALSDPPPSAAGGAASFAILKAAFARVRERPRERALVTAPLSKEAVSASGFAFDGHTGWLGKECGVEEPLMLFAAPGLRLALATVHLPLAEVAPRLRRDGIGRPLRQLRDGLVAHFGIAEPRIAVLALNPHAGEGGLLGREEIEVIGPEIEAFRSLGGPGEVSGPYSADGFFRPANLERFDGVLALYHDQGLVAVKCLAFGSAVNVSLGLPIIRTSVDHGCAYDLAGKGVADSSSLVAALRLADQLLHGPEKTP